MLRGGEIILRSPATRAILIAGLVVVVAIAVVAWLGNLRRSCNHARLGRMFSLIRSAMLTFSNAGGRPNIDAELWR